jgi:ribosomal protein S18 acetylase RimI-like enzyme
MNILEARISDAKEIEKLVNSAYRGDSSKVGWTTEANLLGGIRVNSETIVDLISDQDSRIYIYTAPDGIQGCVNLVLKEKVLYLGMLTVNPELQNSGIGKKLLRYVEEYAIRNLFQQIEMTVISKRVELIAWYERYGFYKTGEKRPFPMNDPKFGIPKMELEFIVLIKKIN